MHSLYLYRIEGQEQRKQEEDDWLDDFYGLDDDAVISCIERMNDLGPTANTATDINHNSSNSNWNPTTSNNRMSHSMNNLALTSPINMNHNMNSKWRPDILTSASMNYNLNNNLGGAIPYSMSSNMNSYLQQPAVSNSMMMNMAGAVASKTQFENQMALGNIQQEYADPCDTLWQQAGEYVQRAFENSNNQLVGNMNYVTNNNLSTSGSSGFNSSVSPDIGNGGFNTVAAGPPSMNKKALFQSSSIAEWVQNCVEVIYDDNNQSWQ
jgi:hypothetical protein